MSIVAARVPENEWLRWAKISHVVAKEKVGAERWPGNMTLHGECQHPYILSGRKAVTESRQVASVGRSRPQGLSGE
jgi:hypothetical protein